MGNYFSIDNDENVILFCSVDMSLKKVGSIKPLQKLNRGIIGIYKSINYSHNLFRREETLIYVEESDCINVDEILKKYGACYVLFEEYYLDFFILMVKPIAISVLYYDLINIKKEKEHIVELNDT